MNLSHRPMLAPISKDIPEAELVLRTIEGDEAAFEAIMRRHNRLLFRAARAILKSDTEAEDALQEAYLKAWRALGSFRSDARLSTWLVRIVVNEAIGRLRRRDAQIIPLDTVMDSLEPDVQASLTGDPVQQPEHIALRAQLRKLVEARIDRLPEAFRTVFMLRAVEEMSVEEVAQALAIPEATVRTRFFRARSLLRESLASEIDVAMGDVHAFDGARCDRVVAGVLTRWRATDRSGKG